MDPISLLIGALVLSGAFTGWVTRVVQHGRTDRAYAAKGMVSPRHQATLARLEKAGIAPRGGSGRTPLRDYLADVWADVWLDAGERRRAKRAARGPYVYDPDRPRWHERVDAFVLDRLRRLREGYNRIAVQRQAEREQPDAGLDVVAEPVEYPPGTVTYGPDGQRLPLAPPAEDVAPDPDADPDPVEDEQPERDEHHDPEPDRQQEDDMTTPAQIQADAATEVNTNEDARRAFEAQVRAAGEAADALAVYEAAQAKLAALAAAGTDGMSAKAFDGNATAAQYDISDLLTTTQMSGAAAAIDGIKTQAEAGVRHLDKYRDAEDLVAAEQVDTTTLAPTAA